MLSANAFNTPRTATVNIGEKVREFKVTTAASFLASVETPSVYNFFARTDAPLDTNVDSNEIVVAGLAAAAAIAVANGEYRVNGGAWTNAPGTVNN